MKERKEKIRTEKGKLYVSDTILFDTTFVTNVYKFKDNKKT